MTSVCRPSRRQLNGFRMDRRGTWFVYSCGLWDVNACFNKFLRALCCAHERFKQAVVVLFAIIFSRVKF